MKPLSQDSVSMSASVTTNNKSLKFQGLPAGEICRRAFIKGTFTLTRGSGGLAHKRETLEEIIDSITMAHGLRTINMSGHTAGALAAFRYGVPQMVNPITISTSETAIVVYWELPLTPVSRLEKLYRPTTEDMEGAVVNVTTKISQYDTTATTGDILTIVGTLELYCQTEPKPQGYKPIPGGIWVEEKSDFSGDALVISDVEVSQFLIKGRTLFADLTLKKGGQVVHEKCTAKDLDVVYHEQIPAVSTACAAPGANAGGHPFAVSYPIMASLALSTTTFAVVFDARNHKGVKGTFDMLLHTRTAATAVPYRFVGWRTK